MPRSRVITVRVPLLVLPKWREAAEVAAAPSFNAWLVKAANWAADHDVAEATDAERKAAARERLRGRVFPAKPERAS